MYRFDVARSRTYYNAKGYYIVVHFNHKSASKSRIYPRTQWYTTNIRNLIRRIKQKQIIQKKKKSVFMRPSTNQEILCASSLFSNAPCDIVCCIYTERGWRGSGSMICAAAGFLMYVSNRSSQRCYIKYSQLFHCLIYYDHVVRCMRTCNMWCKNIHIYTYIPI